jgi:hypothetical protein
MSKDYCGCSNVSNFVCKLKRDFRRMYPEIHQAKRRVPNKDRNCKNIKNPR